MTTHTIHMRKLVALLMIVAAPAVLAQQGGEGAQSKTVYRLFPLEYISNADASRLVAPFVPQSPYYGVFDAGNAVRGITVRAPQDVIDRVDSLLKANDVAPPTVVLRFQLIAALDSTITDNTIPSDVQSSLRDLFKFGGYRALAQGSSTVGTRFGMTNFSVTMASEYERYTIHGMLADVRTRTRAAAGKPGGPSVELQVALEAAANSNGKINPVLSTGLTVPIGQTVVLGSGAAPGVARRALILTVRPEILNTDRR